MQVKLLRLLQEKQYEPLGSQRSERADVRFISATHRDLETMVKRNEFREDLYYRLNVLPIVIPPLRERRDEVPELVATFLVNLAREHHRGPISMDDDALALLVAHAWPGNVRQLENAIERLIVFSDGDRIDARMVESELMLRPTAPLQGTDGDLDSRVRDAERNAIEDALRRTGGNRSMAARLLGISRRTLYYKFAATGRNRGAST